MVQVKDMISALTEATSKGLIKWKRIDHSFITKIRTKNKYEISVKDDYIEIITKGGTKHVIEVWDTQCDNLCHMIKQQLNNRSSLDKIIDDITSSLSL